MDTNDINLDIIVRNNNLYIDSRTIAQAVGKRHDHLIRDIDSYIQAMNEDQNPNLGSDFFFVESSYTAGTGKNYKCYLLTRKGCEMVANKLTGKKGKLLWVQQILLQNLISQSRR